MIPNDLPQYKKAPEKKSLENKQTENAPSHGLNSVQQQFVLRFCRQLASVIQACNQSESAEIEVGRRHIGAQQVRVKLQAKREVSPGVSRKNRD